MTKEEINTLLARCYVALSEVRYDLLMWRYHNDCVWWLTHEMY